MLIVHYMDNGVMTGVILTIVDGGAGLTTYTLFITNDLNGVMMAE